MVCHMIGSMFLTSDKQVYCAACLEPAHHNERYDAYSCLKCRVWLEKQCGEDPCRAGCHERPERPDDLS